jgi:ClpP class serine protease
MSQAAYPHIANRVFGRALAIEPYAFRSLIEGPVGRRIVAGEPTERPAVDQQAMRTKRLALVEARLVSVAGGIGEYGLTPNGIAIVPVMGILSQRFDWLASMCGWTTYEGLAATFDAALDDGRVRAILMDVESPGGEAAGMLDCADMILSARDAKPVWAVANTFAASAAYALAGSAEVLFLPRLGQVGSIGAVCVHVDQSAQDAAVGERYTAVYSGARKVDGWPHAPLSDAAASAMQDGVDHCRDQFAQLVGRQGRISMSGAIATEAAMYHDAEAVAAGLADRVGSFGQALEALGDEIGDQTVSSTYAAQTAIAAAAGRMRADAYPNKPAPGCACPDCKQVMPLDPGRVAYVHAVVDLCAQYDATAMDAHRFYNKNVPLQAIAKQLEARRSELAAQARFAREIKPSDRSARLDH